MLKLWTTGGIFMNNRILTSDTLTTVAHTVRWYEQTNQREGEEEEGAEKRVYQIGHY